MGTGVRSEWTSWIQHGPDHAGNRRGVESTDNVREPATPVLAESTTLTVLALVLLLFHKRPSEEDKSKN